MFAECCSGEMPITVIDPMPYRSLKIPRDGWLYATLCPAQPIEHYRKAANVQMENSRANADSVLSVPRLIRQLYRARRWLSLLGINIRTARGRENPHFHPQALDHFRIIRRKVFEKRCHFFGESCKSVIHGTTSLQIVIPPITIVKFMEARRSIRILFLADTHLGFDYPIRPRIKRRRRGDDFFDNYHRALSAAHAEGIDLVIHGGDVFFRSKVPQAIVVKAFEPLMELAESGIPVLIVPGNHERSKIPISLFSLHSNIHIFEQAGVYLLRANDIKITLCGFPYFRDNVRREFPHILGRIRSDPNYDEPADVRVLCMHQIVEGARIGVYDYVFRTGGEVIRAVDIPSEIDIFLSGHIHRYQILRSGLDGKGLGAPVFYPGSIERTSFAERNEVKGYLILEITLPPNMRRPTVSHQFIPLPTRPMVSFDLNAGEVTPQNILSTIGKLLDGLAADSVVRISFRGILPETVKGRLTAQHIRNLAPDSMNVALSFPGRFAHSDGML